MTYYNDDKVITEISYNWFQSNDGHEAGEDYTRCVVGRQQADGKTPTDIKEHCAQGEGDKWFYDIFFDNGTVTRVFNPNTVTFTAL